MSVVAHQALLLLVLLVAYWKWSVASLVLMDMTLLGAIGVDAIRMWFVSIHHRRTFG